MIWDQFRIEMNHVPESYYVVERAESSLDGTVTWACTCEEYDPYQPYVDHPPDCEHIQYYKTFGAIPLDPMLMAMIRAQRAADGLKIAP